MEELINFYTNDENIKADEVADARENLDKANRRAKIYNIVSKIVPIKYFKEKKALSDEMVKYQKSELDFKQKKLTAATESRALELEVDNIVHFPINKSLNDGEMEQKS